MEEQLKDEKKRKLHYDAGNTKFLLTDFPFQLISENIVQIEYIGKGTQCFYLGQEPIYCIKGH